MTNQQMPLYLLSETIILGIVMFRIKKYLRKLYGYLSDRTASPLVEEGLLIGLAILIFLVILTIVSDIIDWINELSAGLPGS